MHTTGDDPGGVWPKLTSLLEDVRRRGYRLYLTVDPKRDGYGAELSPEAEALQMAVSANSSALLGLLCARGPEDLLWLELLAGADATSLLVKWQGRRATDARNRDRK